MWKFALLFAWLMPSFALGQTISSTDARSIANAMQDLGYRAVIGVDNVGDPKITSSSNGVNFSMFFYGCRNNAKCRDIQFSAGFDVDDPLTALKMNQWNYEKVAGTASIDDEGDPWIRMLVPGATYMSEADFNRIMVRWDDALAEFMDYVDW